MGIRVIVNTHIWSKYRSWLWALAVMCTLFDPASSKTVGASADFRKSSQVKPADNSRCHVCHMNFEDEDLAVTHAKNGIGCEECHGKSKAHAADEDNITAPDIMYPKSKITAACEKCHTSTTLAKTEQHKSVLAGTANDRTACTDCHGEHRMNNRRNRWDKETGKLLPKAEAVSATPARKSVPLFNGRTFNGWEGDTNHTFRIQDGAVVGGNLKAPIPRNEFLCTTKAYTNFIVHVECKLFGPANGGIQVRSHRVLESREVSGYQADMSAETKGGCWGCLYDEARRNRFLVKPDQILIQKALKPSDWNYYEIRCEGPRIQLFLNGVQTADFTETEPIPNGGIIGLQIHGGSASEAWYRNISIEELP